jgi:uncharacterized protein with PQ loop repeat
MEHATDLITWLFVAANTGRVLAYLPQVAAAWNCKTGAASISRMTWGYFAVAHLTGVLYAYYVAHDTRMTLMFLGNLTVCTLLVLIVTWKKMAHARDRSDSPTGQVTVLHGSEI